MKKFISLVLRKILQTILTLAVVVTLVFFITRLLPGTPFDEQLPEHLKAPLLEKYKLTSPIGTQYFQYLQLLIRGELGDSIAHPGLNVFKTLGREGALSFELGAWALLWALGFGLFIGLGSLLWSMPLQSSLQKIIATVMSVPSFVVASVLVWLFCFYWPVFPVALWTSTANKTLPIICAGLRPFCLVVRILRQQGQHILSQPLTVALLAKGISQRRLLAHHVAPLAIQPLLPILGTLIADLLTGSLIVELIFGLQGLGVVFLRAVEERDYNFVCGLALVFAALLIILNQIFETLRLVLDPRQREAR